MLFFLLTALKYFSMIGKIFLVVKNGNQYRKQEQL